MLLKYFYKWSYNVITKEVQIGVELPTSDELPWKFSFKIQTIQDYKSIALKTFKIDC